MRRDPVVHRRTRLHVYRKHIGRDVTMVFPIHGVWHSVPHDELVRIVGENANYPNTPSWRERGGYSTESPNHRVREALEPYRVGGEP